MSVQDPEFRWEQLYTLDKQGPDLVQQASKGRLDFAFERTQLLTRFSVALMTENVLLVGPNGVGKRSLVHSVAHRMAGSSGSRLPQHFPFRRVIATDPNALELGAHYVGELGEKLDRIAASARREGAILFLRDAHLASGTGASSSSPHSDVATVLNGALDRHPCRVVGETTPEGAVLLARRARSFFERFTVLEVPPLDERTTRTLLELMRVDWSERWDLPVRFAPGFVDEILHICRSFFAGEHYPGKAVDLARSVLSGISRFESAAEICGTPQILRSFLARSTGVAPDLMSPEPMPRGVIEQSVRAVVEDRVIEQPDATAAAVRLVTRFRARLNDPSRPLGVLWLSGPTGVGKTEFAKALAELFFGADHRLVRFDMSEFRDLVSLERLVGSVAKRDSVASGPPPLVERIRQQPFSVILFDEIEKAHPLVLDLMLQLLDESRLTGADGSTARFNNTVILFTSNLGGLRTASPGFGQEAREPVPEEIRDLIATSFRPEFANRVETIVCFRALQRPAIERLLDRELRALLRLPGLQHVRRIVVARELRESIVRAGYDLRYGARPLKRAVSTMVVAPIAQLLTESVPAGQAIVIDALGEARYVADRRRPRLRRSSRRRGVEPAPLRAVRE